MNTQENKHAKIKLLTPWPTRPQLVPGVSQLVAHQSDILIQTGLVQWSLELSYHILDSSQKLGVGLKDPNYSRQRNGISHLGGPLYCLSISLFSGHRSTVLRMKSIVLDRKKREAYLVGAKTCSYPLPNSAHPKNFEKSWRLRSSCSGGWSGGVVQPTRLEGPFYGPEGSNRSLSTSEEFVDDPITNEPRSGRRHGRSRGCGGGRAARLSYWWGRRGPGRDLSPWHSVFAQAFKRSWGDGWIDVP